MGLVVSRPELGLVAWGRCRSCGKWYPIHWLLSYLLGCEGEGTCLPGLAQTRPFLSPWAESQIELLISLQLCLYLLVSVD